MYRDILSWVLEAMKTHESDENLQIEHCGTYIILLNNYYWLIEAVCSNMFCTTEVVGKEVETGRPVGTNENTLVCQVCGVGR